MNTNTDNHIDKTLRNVMERRAAKIPALSDTFTEQVMNKMNARKEQQLHRVSTPLHSSSVKRSFGSSDGRGWGWVLSIAAAVFIAFLLWPNSHEKAITKQEVKPVVAEANPQPIPQPIVEEKKEEVLEEKKPLIASCPRQKRAIPTCVPGKTETTTAMPASEAVKEESPVALSESKPRLPVIVIPPDKQALADIYLAEEALQVVYERKAQQDAIRAYAASLTGEEMPEPVIAF